MADSTAVNVEVVDEAAPAADPAAGSLPLHPVIEMIREKELEKLVLGFGGAVAMALVISDTDSDNKAGAKVSETLLGHLVVTGLSAGCMAIWNGIVLRETFQRAALVMEQLGIVLVLVSFIALVASALPACFAWVPILCGCFCLFPYFFLITPAAATPEGIV